MRQFIVSLGCAMAIVGGTAAGADDSAPTALAGSTGNDGDAVSRILPPSVSPPARYSDAVEEDLMVLAAEKGISPSEARRRYGWQEQAARALSALMDRFPDAVAYSRMEDDSDNPRMVVAFRDAAPTGVEDRFSSLPVPVVLISNIGYSANEFIDAIAQAHYEAINSSGTEVVSSGGDIEAGTIDVVVDSQSAGASPTSSYRLAAVGRSKVPVSLAVRPDTGGQGDVSRIPLPTEFSTRSWFTPGRG